MVDTLKLLDVVALLDDVPEEDLRRGYVGTIVENLALGVYLVEFADRQGRTYAELPLRAEQLLRLYHEPPQAA